MVGGEGIKLALPPLGDAEGVDPGVELQAQLVGLLHPVGQGIKAVFGGGTLGTGEVLAPGIILRGIEGIGGGPHLEDYGGHAHIRTVFQDLVGVRLQHRRVCGGLAGIVQAVHRGHPHGPEVLLLPGRGGGSARLGTASQAHQDQGTYQDQGQDWFPMLYHGFAPLRGRYCFAICSARSLR